MLHLHIQAEYQCTDYASREHSTRRAGCPWCRHIARAYQRAAELAVELHAAERLGALLCWHGKAEFRLRQGGRANATETTKAPLRLEVRMCVDAACPHHLSQRYDIHPPACAICLQLESAQRRSMQLEGELRALTY